MRPCQSECIFCPALKKEFERRHPEAGGDYLAFFGAPYRIIYDPGFAWNFDEVWRIPGRETVDWMRYYPDGFTHGVKFDGWGVAHDDSPDAHHMTCMHHPLARAASVAELESYPWPDFDRLSFNGTLGTQQLMPYGTPQQVCDEVRRNLALAGAKGGLFCCPTHMLEPEVPWANIEAYIEACRAFKP